MTAIVAVSQGSKMLFGSDSAATADDALATMADAKVFRHGEVLFGCAGSFRAAQLVRYAFSPPKKRGDLDKYMATTFMDALREVLTKGGHATKKDQEETIDASILVGYRGTLFVVYGDFGIERVRDPFNAIGSGSAPALGALYATRDQGATKSRVLVALRAAEAYTASVRSPFAVISNDP